MDNLHVLLAAVTFLALCRLGISQSPSCYHCNDYQASPSDPGLQNAIYQLGLRQPQNSQCNNFPYHSSSAIPMINCNSLNYTMYGNPMDGIPFTGWKCMKQTYTVMLKNYGNGNTVQVPTTVRGCIPVQHDNPYGHTTCFSLSDTTNPYVRTLISMLYFPQDNVGPVTGNYGAASGNPGITSNSGTDLYDGKLCICGNSKCNHSGSLVAPRTFVLLLLATILLIASRRS